MATDELYIQDQEGGTGADAPAGTDTPEGGETSTEETTPAEGEGESK